MKLRKTTSSESSMAILSNLYNATENLEIERKNFLECVGKIQNFDLNVYVMDYVKSYNNLDLMYLRLMDLY